MSIARGGGSASSGVTQKTTRWWVEWIEQCKALVSRDIVASLRQATWQNTARRRLTVTVNYAGSEFIVICIFGHRYLEGDVSFFKFCYNYIFVEFEHAIEKLMELIE